MAEARWRLGYRGPAVAFLERIDTCAPAKLRAKKQELQSLIAKEAGQHREAIEFARECIRTANSEGSSLQVCRGQLALLSILLDQQGPAASESVATDVRRNIIRAGDPFLFAWLHALFAEFEARSGNGQRGARHLDAGFRLVERSPNAWLLGLLWNVRSALEWSAGSITEALRSARRGRDAAKLSGHERARRTALANIAYFSLWAGEAEQAHAAFEELGNSIEKGSSLWYGLLDSQILQAMGTLDLRGAESLLVAGETETRLGGLPESLMAGSRTVSCPGKMDGGRRRRSRSAGEIEARRGKRG